MTPRAITNCQSKKRYDTRDQAVAQEDYLWREKGVDVSVYKCPMCEGWHLTRSR